MITPYRGKFHIEEFKKVVSTEFAFNDLVYIDANGYLTPAVDGALIKPVGNIQQVIATTDSDYASATKVAVLVGDTDAEYICDVGTGTAAQTDVGEYIDIDDAQDVDVSASTYDVLFVTGLVSTSKIIAKICVKGGAVA